MGLEQHLESVSKDSVLAVPMEQTPGDSSLIEGELSADVVVVVVVMSVVVVSVVVVVVEFSSSTPSVVDEFPTSSPGGT